VHGLHELDRVGLVRLLQLLRRAVQLFDLARRIFLGEREPHDPGRNAVAHPTLFRLAAHVHGNRDAELEAVGPHLPPHQVLAHCSRHDGEHHVVDAAIERPAHGLDLVQAQLDPIDPAVGAEKAVERSVGGRNRLPQRHLAQCAHPGGDLAGKVLGLAYELAQPSGQVERKAEQAQPRIAPQLGVARLRARHVAMRLPDRELGRRREEAPGEIHPRRAVGSRIENSGVVEKRLLARSIPAAPSTMQ
jgi:hypothetical protein